MRRLLACVVLVGAVAGCGGGGDFKQVNKVSEAPKTPEALQVSGTVNVPSDGGLNSGEACTAQPGYDDIQTGEQVVVSDEVGKTLGIGDLEGGTFDGASSCVFQFSVSGVAADAKFYKIHVGNVNRGEVQYTAEDLAKPVALSLGG